MRSLPHCAFHSAFEILPRPSSVRLRPYCGRHPVLCSSSGTFSNPMAVPVLPGFKRQGLEAPRGQLAAGEFYRELLDAGFSPVAAGVAAAPHAAEAAGQSHAPGTEATARAAGSTQAEPSQRWTDAPAHATAAGVGRLPAGSADEGAEPDVAAAPTAGLGSAGQLEILSPVSRAEASSRAGENAGPAAIVGPSLHYGIPASNLGFQVSTIRVL